MSQPTTTVALAPRVAMDEISDATLIDETASALAVPRAKSADSFVLHAPLELLARAALLPMVEPNGRDDARARLRWLAESFTVWGGAADPPELLQAPFLDQVTALVALRGALDEGDLDMADVAATWLASHLDSNELAHALADSVVRRLSAAAHGSIFLYNLPRIAPRTLAPALMLRCLVREMARYPDWNLSWFRDAPPRSSNDRPNAAAELMKRLRRPESPGDPGSNFIFPVMSLTESSGRAQEELDDLVRDVTPAEARRVLLRTAAMSMLQDDPSQAPYGWSHCLTMPQATIGVAHLCAEPWHAVAVASTYVLGFRSTLGHVELDLAWVPPRPHASDTFRLLDGSPADAAAGAWYADRAVRPAIVARLATRASAHHDAHLVKYTLACFDAAHADPEAASLYLAAAAYLSAWWRQADESA